MKKLSLDYCRVFASLLVVAIHIYPLATISPNLDFLFTHVFCRVAVPLFLVITGYFLLYKALEDKKILIKYTKKILNIYLLCSILYLPIHIYAKDWQNLSILELLQDIFINGTFYHLWYFPSLIIGIWFLYGMIKKCSSKQVSLVILVLYLIGLLGDSYYGVSIKIPILKSFYYFIFRVTKYTRNGLFYVPIFLYIGYYLKKQMIKIPIKTNCVFLIFFLFLLELEGFILHYFKMQRHDSMYFFLLPVMYYLFLLLLRLKNIQNKRLRNISTMIYIIHPIFIIVVRGIAKIIHQESIMINNNLIHYLCVVLLSLLFSILLERGKEVVVNVYNKRKE